MEYILIVILQTLGVLFQAAVKVKELDNKFPDDSLQDVIKEFWKSDKITLMISGLIVVLHIVTHYIIEEYTDIAFTTSSYSLINFGVALILGYGGQKLIYTYLGKAENALMRKADKIDNL
jgi:uncharacterized membrane protein